MLKQATPTAGSASRVHRLRVLALGSILTVLAGYVAVAVVLGVVAALSLELSQISPPGIVLSAGPGWLAAYQVPVAFKTATLGVQPLLLTMGLFALVAASAKRIAQRAAFDRPVHALPLIGSMAIGHALFGVAIAIMAGSSAVKADPLEAFLLPALIGGVAATVGVARRCRLLDAVETNTDVPGAWGVRAGVIATAAMWTVGALVYTVASGWQAPTMARLFAADVHGVGSGLALLLTCIGYLPNAVIGGLSFASGAGVSVGPVSAGPFGFSGGDVAAVPLFAGVPAAYSPWWLAVLVLPLGVGIAVGWKLRAVSERPWQRVRSVVVAGAVVGLALVVLGALASGRLGLTGSFDVHAGILSLVGFGWVVVPGSLVAVFGGRIAGLLRRSGSSEQGSDGNPAQEETDGEQANEEQADAPDAPESEKSAEPEPEEAEPEPDEAESEPEEPKEPVDDQTKEPASEEPEPAKSQQEPEESTVDEPTEESVQDTEKSDGDQLELDVDDKSQDVTSDEEAEPTTLNGSNQDG